MNQQKPKKHTKMETVRRNPLHDPPERLEEFTENLLDESVPAHGDAPASSSRELPSELRAEVVSGKHSIFTHFPKDRSSDICMKTKITRVLCRKRTGAAVPRAENFGDLITADHKVLSEGCESRNNHRYTVVVRDLATQWVQSYQCKTKTSQKNSKKLAKVSGAQRRSRKSFTLTIHWNSAELVKIFPGIIVRQRHTDRKHMGLLKEEYAEVKKGHHAVLLPVRSRQ